MPLFTVREIVTTYSPYGSPIPHSSRLHYRGYDKLAAVSVYFKRYDELGVPIPPKKTAKNGITAEYTKNHGPFSYSYWLRLEVDDGNPTDEDA